MTHATIRCTAIRLQSWCAREWVLPNWSPQCLVTICEKQSRCTHGGHHCSLVLTSSRCHWPADADYMLFSLAGTEYRQNLLSDTARESQWHCSPTDGHLRIVDQVLWQWVPAYAQLSINLVGVSCPEAVSSCIHTCCQVHNRTYYVIKCPSNSVAQLCLYRHRYLPDPCLHTVLARNHPAKLIR